MEDFKRDPSDTTFLALAKQVGADYIASGDPDLTDLGEFEGILILTPTQFLDVLNTTEKK